MKLIYIKVTEKNKRQPEWMVGEECHIVDLFQAFVLPLDHSQFPWLSRLS